MYSGSPTTRWIERTNENLKHIIRKESSLSTRLRIRWVYSMKFIWWPCSSYEDLMSVEYLLGSRFSLVSLFNGISTLCRLFNTKAVLLEEQKWYYLTHSWEDNEVHTFPKGICPKVNVIAWLEYELAYYDSAVHRFNHYTTRTPPS